MQRLQRFSALLSLTEWKSGETPVRTSSNSSNGERGKVTQARARRGEASVQTGESNVAGYDKTGRLHRIKLHCSSNKRRKRGWIFMSHSTPDDFQTTQFVCLTRSMVWLFKAFWKPPFYYTHYYLVHHRASFTHLFCSLIIDIALSAFLWPGGDKRLL